VSELIGLGDLVLCGKSDDDGIIGGFWVGGGGGEGLDGVMGYNMMVMI
jgi:hypothetical protein